MQQHHAAVHEGQVDQRVLQVDAVQRLLGERRVVERVAIVGPALLDVVDVDLARPAPTPPNGYVIARSENSGRAFSSESFASRVFSSS